MIIVMGDPQGFCGADFAFHEHQIFLGHLQSRCGLTGVNGQQTGVEIPPVAFDQPIELTGFQVLVPLDPRGQFRVLKGVDEGVGVSGATAVPTVEHPATLHFAVGGEAGVTFEPEFALQAPVRLGDGLFFLLVLAAVGIEDVVSAETSSVNIHISGGEVDGVTDVSEAWGVEGEDFDGEVTDPCARSGVEAGGCCGHR
ncbi:hypothetical protein [Deinococcus cellulosilyticus]|uniref:hypothetical protein n=1 Tax=Deinococcus cellulosilyticus TaxID=401558 RepID=UPI0016499847|nr:hypothetical protein [Deinococcus cellulosilyticus]